ncbi:hypothetical protein VNO80_15473 [Phaseolus coccineus]|uniref:Uncharacterized protein n=1 Tax=Phaseolus coccineus TaxID=3886 RepID=A0AAN9MKA8_PHACN
MKPHKAWLHQRRCFSLARQPTSRRCFQFSHSAFDFDCVCYLFLFTSYGPTWHHTNTLPCPLLHDVNPTSGINRVLNSNEKMPRESVGVCTWLINKHAKLFGVVSSYKFGS